MSGRGRKNGRVMKINDMCKFSFLFLLHFSMEILWEIYSISFFLFCELRFYNFFLKNQKKNEYEKIIRWEIFMEIYEEFLVRNLITEQIRIFRELWWTIYMQWIMFYCLNLKDEETIKENVWRAYFGFFQSQKIASNFVRKFKNL